MLPSFLRGLVALAALAVGQQALCVADAYLQQPFAAVLKSIAPAVDAQRGVVELRLKVDPVPAFLRQDLTVSVNIRPAERAQARAVPNDALRDLQGNAASVLRVRDGRVQRVPVTLGLRGLTLTEVTAGLAAGDRVLAGAATVAAADGQRLRVTLQALPDAASAEAAQRGELPVRFD